MQANFEQKPYKQEESKVDDFLIEAANNLIMAKNQYEKAKMISAKKQDEIIEESKYSDVQNDTAI